MPRRRARRSRSHACSTGGLPPSIGTHTHVQTNDARVLAGGTAALTDAGMTGPHDSVIGVRAELAIERMRTGMPVRFHPAEGDVRIEGVLVECTPEGRATRCETVRVSRAIAATATAASATRTTSARARSHVGAASPATRSQYASRKPELRQDERGCQERPRPVSLAGRRRAARAGPARAGTAARAPCRSATRAATARPPSGDQLFLRAASRSRREPDADDGQRLEGRRRVARASGSGAGQVLRAEARDNGRHRTTASCGRREQRSRAEALDLQRAPGLALEARLRARRGDEREAERRPRREDEPEEGEARSPCRGGPGGARGRRARSAAARADRASPRPPARARRRTSRSHRQERRQRPDGEHRGPEVESREQHRPERERRQPEEGGRRVEASGPRPDGGERGDGEERSSQRPAGRDEPPRRPPIVLGRGERREREHGKRAGRILDREVPVGHPAVEDRFAVALVGGRIDDLGIVERPRVEEPEGEQEQGDAERGGCKRRSRRSATGCACAADTTPVLRRAPARAGRARPGVARPAARPRGTRARTARRSRRA